MLSLGTLGLTGAIMYGGVKALRTLLSPEAKRPTWLKSPKLAGVAVIPNAGSGASVADTEIVLDPADESSSFWNYMIQDEEGRKLSIVALSGTTAAIHIALGLQAGLPLFIWNGAGFVAFAASQYFVPQWEPYRGEIRDGFLAYTGTTIVAYFLVGGPAGLASVVGMTTKLVEAGLFALLWREAEDQ